MPSARYFCIFINVGLGESAFGLKNSIILDSAGVTKWEVPEELKKVVNVALPLSVAGEAAEGMKAVAAVVMY